jgi:ribosomal-protein-alanine N-acetyltransferase
MTKVTIDYSQFKLIPAPIEQYPTIQNLGRFYVYDMSEYLGDEEGWEMPEDGLYECIDFKKYWQTDDAFPFLVRYDHELAGFVIVDKKGSDSQIQFNMAQFFILRKFKGKGVGRYIAHQCFKEFHGIWEVMVMPNNKGAYHFWRSIIADFTKEYFEEYTRTIPHLNNSVKRIFKFNSDQNCSKC